MVLSGHSVDHSSRQHASSAGLHVPNSAHHEQPYLCKQPLHDVASAQSLTASGEPPLDEDEFVPFALDEAIVATPRMLQEVKI